MKKILMRMLTLFFGLMLCTCVPMNVSATALEQELPELSEADTDHDSEISLASDDQEPELSAAAENSRTGANVSLTAADVDRTERTYRVTLKQSAVQDATRILFAVWGLQNGQDDLRWYTAQKMSDGSYMYDVSVSSHRQAGTYVVHAYADRPNGSSVFLGQTTFEVSAPAAASVTVTNYNAATGSFQVWVSGIRSTSGIRQVQIPIWCASDQSDIRWYPASLQPNGSYAVQASVSNHGFHMGKYNIHVYAESGNGILSYVGGTTQEVSASIGALSASNPDKGEMNYQVVLSGVQIPGGVKEVQFAVWGDQGGQDDLRWYKATKYSDGSYACAFPISNHKQLGTYNVHAYAVNNSGAMQILKATTFQVKNAPSGKVSVANLNKNAGTFDIVLSNISAPSGVQSVLIPVWHAADQSDIKWYNARLQSNGTYAVSANIANHNFNTGGYNIHAYVTMRNGIMACVSGTTAQVDVAYQVQSSKISDSQYQVSLSAPWVNGNGAKVMFPTWSDANGQDDIIWYEGTRSSNGVWSVTVDGARHRSPGSFSTHAYVMSNGKNTFAGAVSYSMNFSVQQSRLAGDVNIVLSQSSNGSTDPGTQLRNSYNWVVNNISYRTLPIPMQPETGYTSEQWYAIYGIEQRAGNCYCYAAAFAAVARQLGYDATMISGSVPLLAGGYGPHAWVELNINGVTYVCDPESQREYPNYGFYMVTYATAPYAYRK